jgi:hypothetical protein
MRGNMAREEDQETQAHSFKLLILVGTDSLGRIILTPHG